METDQIRSKIQSFGVGVLDGVDPNPENFCGAGVIHSKTQQMGCLLRLEPNRQAGMFRLTIRSNKFQLSIRYKLVIRTNTFKQLEFQSTQTAHHQIQHITTHHQIQDPSAKAWCALAHHHPCPTISADASPPEKRRLRSSYQRTG